MNTYSQLQQEHPGGASTRSREGATSRPHSLFADARPGTTAQRKLDESLNQSAGIRAQLQLQQMLNQGPRVVAQAQMAQTLSERNGSHRNFKQSEQTVQRQEAPEEKELGALPDEVPVEDVAPLKEEGPLQGKFAPAQKESGVGARRPLPGKVAPVRKSENRTGLPAGLKTNVENLSGISMDDVKVHYNSARPAQMSALAVTQGKNIHVGPGQERYLPHEAWHVVQQKQGRVRPTVQAKGVPVNDDSALEREADLMGERAARFSSAVQMQRDGGGAAAPSRKSGCMCAEQGAEASTATVPENAASEPSALTQPVQRTATGEVVQLAKVVAAPDEANDLVEYVVVDVPGDGSCMLHAFNLGFFTQQLLENLLSTHDPGALSPDGVEQLALEAFHERILGKESTESVDTAFNLIGKDLRSRIAARWWDTPGPHIASLQRDIQAIIHSLLTRENLERRELTEESGVSSPKLSESTGGTSLLATSSTSPSTPQTPPTEMDDIDFIFNAVYYPERLKQVPTKSNISQKGVSVSSLSSAMFAVTMDEVMNMHVPMGVRQDGQLAHLIRQYVIGIGRPYAVGPYLPLHSVVIPPATNIPPVIVKAYIEEFNTNMALWASETALSTASALSDTQVCLHTFSDEDEWTASRENFPGTTGRVNIYETGAQTHFQMMIGPFPPGWLKEPEIIEPEPMNESATVVWPTETGEMDSSGMLDEYPSFLSEKHFSEHPIIEYFDAEKSDLDPEDMAYINRVAFELGRDFSSPGDLIEYLYRAGAEVGVENIFELPPRKVAEVVEHLEGIYKQREERRSKFTGHVSQYRDPLIPLAGFVPELVDRFHIPVAEIGRLLPHVQAYLGFHKKRSTWEKSEAGPRTEALREMAKILNEWAERYEEPELRRGPSMAQYTAIESPLGHGEQVGTAMRSLLTINPGNLVGYEPEESTTWLAFRDALGGFVRAHLLNKHLGGPGSPQNIAYMSSQDNTRMSQMGEEYVKRAVIEYNKQMFFGVQMPLGRPEFQEPPHYLNENVARVLVKEVLMQTAEVEPFVNEDEELDVLVKNVFLKDVLGIKDADVGQSTSGALSFATKPPDLQYITKIQPNHLKRLAHATLVSTTPSLKTMWLEDEKARNIVLGAQEALRNASSSSEEKDILESARSQLGPLLTEKQLAEQMLKLGDVRRQSGAVTSTAVRKEEKTKKQAKKRAEFLETHKIKESSNLYELVAGASDIKFGRIKTLLAEGATLEQAVTYGVKSKKEYEQFRERLKREQKGTDIMSYFGK